MEPEFTSEENIGLWTSQTCALLVAWVSHSAFVEFEHMKSSDPSPSVALDGQQ